MRIYISGKITGLDLKEAEAKFKEAEIKLRDAGHEPVNPCEILPYHPDHKWEDYLIEDIKAIFTCDGILMLDNWQTSKGAKMEKAVAEAYGLPVFYCQTHNLF